MGDQNHVKGHSQVPAHVTVASVLIIPTLVAIVNLIMVMADLQLLQLKFSATQSVVSTSGLAAGVAVLVSISAGYSFLAASLVSYVAPVCAGSGIPEVLGFLNGNEVPGIFTVSSFLVRTSAIVLVQTAGFPVGREGPMVAIGGSVGFGVAWLLLRRAEMRVDEVITGPKRNEDQGEGSMGLATTTLVVNEELFQHVKRVGCALGGAAGIATAFNAPIGGILYMFEELAVSSLPPDLAKFMCTVIASLAMKALLHVTQMDVHSLVIYEEDVRNSDGGWDWVDMPPVALMAALLGCLGALFSKLLLSSWSFRRKMVARVYKQQRWAKVLDCVFYCIICALIWGFVPALFECQPIPEASSAGHADTGHRQLSGESHLNYVQHFCPEGHYSELASYFLSGAEGFVKHLYSLGDVQRSGPLAVAMLLYFSLACGMPGTPVPMGTFVPSMVIGALAGRWCGENLNACMDRFGGPKVAAPGFYAIVGSGAVLAGLTHMTVGIVALLAEAVGDFGLVAPLMLSVFVAQTASKLISNLGYDEHLIIMKGIPFLDPEIPHELSASGLKAADIIVELPCEALLPSKATLRAIKRALRHKKIKYFPIIDEGSICIGLTTRGRLKAVVSAVSSHQAFDRLTQRRPSFSSTTSTNSDVSGYTSSDGDGSVEPRQQSSGHLVGAHAEAKVMELIRVVFANPMQQPEEADECEGDTEALLPLEKIMDSAPHALQEDMPVSRFYNVFNKTHANVAVVVSKRGRFRGILTRQDIVEAHARLQAEKRHDAHPATVPASRWQISRGSSDAHKSTDHVGNTVSDTRAVNPDADDQVATAVLANMSPEEMQVELKAAWARARSNELAQDKLQNRLGKSQQKVRDLELQIYGSSRPHSLEDEHPSSVFRVKRVEGDGSGGNVEVRCI